ncbi:hypothetical protein RSOL_365270, partial [Rhizoctonia solani AG-3 Rhs1AP]
MTPPLPETPSGRKRARIRSDGETPPTQAPNPSPPPLASWSSRVKNLRHAFSALYNDFCKHPPNETELKSPELVLNGLFALRLDFMDLVKNVDIACQELVDHNPELAGNLPLVDKQTNTDDLPTTTLDDNHCPPPQTEDEPELPPPLRSFASVASLHTPRQTQPRRRHNFRYHLRVIT